MSSRLVRILQIRAFPFRHCTEFGSPSQNRTEVGRVRAGRFATKLRGGSCFLFVSNWSACGVLPTVLALPRRGLFYTSFRLS